MKRSTPHEYRHRAEGDGICRCGKPSSHTIHTVGIPNYDEPQVTLSIPAEVGQSPVEAVEEFIAMLTGGSARAYVYVVSYGDQNFRVDMASNPPMVTNAGVLS